MPSELEELVGFLHDDKAAVREIALSHLVPYSSTGQQQSIFKYGGYRAITDLKKIVQEPEQKPKSIGEALTIMTNLCDDPQIREMLVGDDKFVSWILQSLVDLKNNNADIECMLMANMAHSESVLKIFKMQVKLETEKQKETFKSTQAMDCLMDLFVKGCDRKLNPYATYDFLSYFFADISRFPEGRTYMVTKQQYDDVVPITKLLVFTTKYDSKVRRQGVASTIKNSLFDTDKQMMLLQDPDINLLPFLLTPIALPENKGLDDEEIMSLPEELQFLDADKETESQSEIVHSYLESLLLLCVTREGRDYLREKGVYPLIRELHKEHPEDEKLGDLVYRLVQMIKGEEKPASQFDAESEKRAAKEMLSKVDPNNVAESDSDSDDDDDSDDDKITEIV